MQIMKLDIPSRSRSKRLWLFTEHRNATALINFELPQMASTKQMNVSYESWSSQEVASLGLDALTALLKDKASASTPDAAIFSRFVLPHGLALIALCRSLGVKTFFHLDDLLLQLPTDIGQKYSEVYSAKYVAELQACILATDGVLASTPVLAEQLATRHPQLNIQTILGVCHVELPGWKLPGIRSRLARLKRKLTTSGTQTLGYMGSSSHERDLATISPQIAELMRAKPHIHFETLGLSAPKALKAEFGNRVREFGYTRNYAEFLAALYELGWDLGLAPLVQDDFNRAKTATKFVEYTACGIPTLAEDIETYASLDRQHVAISLATKGAWANAADQMLSNPARLNRQLLQAQQLCRRNFNRTAALGRLLVAIDK